MASNSLRGHGGQRHTPYNLRTNELRLHVKFESPRFTGLAVHRFQTEVQTKKGLSNIKLDVRVLISLLRVLMGHVRVLKGPQGFSGVIKGPIGVHKDPQRSSKVLNGSQWSLKVLKGPQKSPRVLQVHWKVHQGSSRVKIIWTLQKGKMALIDRPKNNVRMRLLNWFWNIVLSAVVFQLFDHYTARLPGL